MENPIESLINQGYLKTPVIVDAFRKIDRADFLVEEIKDEARLNIPLPIGFEQTISQPLTVAFMLELLEPKPGDKILDIGSGSGWTTALLSYIVGRKGKVFALEIIPELKEFGEKNVSKYNFIEKKIAKFICADGSKGLPEEAPFDKILVSAAAEKIPQVLKEQLKIGGPAPARNAMAGRRNGFAVGDAGGRLVIPIKSSIFLIIKKDKNKYEEKEFFGFAFVPLVKK